MKMSRSVNKSCALCLLFFALFITSTSGQDINFNCSDAPPSRLEPGVTAYVSLPDAGETGFSLRVRAEPGGREVGLLTPGTLFKVFSEPECDADGLLWWNIRTFDGETLGWSVEALSPDNYLITPVDIGRREQITTWNAHFMVPLGSVGLGLEDPDHPSLARDIAISQNGSLLAVAENEITLWNMQTGELVNRLPYSTETYRESIVFSPDGQVLAATYQDSISFISIPDGNKLQSFTGTFPFTWSGDGQFFIYSVPNDSGELNETIIVRDISSGEDVASIELAASISDIAFSPDSSILAVAANNLEMLPDEDGNLVCQPGHVYLWNLEQVLDEKQNMVGMEAAAWDIGECNAVDITFRPDGDILAIAQDTGRGVELSEDATHPWYFVQLWDVTDGEKLGELSGEKSPVFSQSGDILATLTLRDLRAFRLWNAQLGGEIAAFGDAYYTGHAPFPSKIVFSSDGTLMIVLWKGYFPFSRVEFWGIPILE